MKNDILKKYETKWEPEFNGGESFCFATPSPSFEIKRDYDIFPIGSCFARHIEDYLQAFGYKLHISDSYMKEANILFYDRDAMNRYNPASIYQDIKDAADMYESGGFSKDIASKSMMKLPDGTFADLGTRMEKDSSTEQLFYAQREAFFNYFKNSLFADIVIITLGMTEAWYDNCKERFIHSHPVKLMRHDKSRFSFKNISYSEVISYLDKTINLIRKYNPSAKFILTVSPIPLLRTFNNIDIRIANMTSKTTLRAAVAEIVTRHEHVDYFPSYENALYSPKDAVWQKQDGRHVKAGFVGRIVTSLAKNYFSHVSDEEINYVIALINFNETNYDNAMDYINLAIAANPETVRNILLKAKLFFEQKKFTECLQLIEPMCDNDNKMVSDIACILSAKIAIENKDLSKAVNRFIFILCNKNIDTSFSEKQTKSFIKINGLINRKNGFIGQLKFQNYCSVNYEEFTDQEYLKYFNTAYIALIELAKSGKTKEAMTVASNYKKLLDTLLSTPYSLQTDDYPQVAGLILEYLRHRNSSPVIVIIKKLIRKFEMLQDIIQSKTPVYINKSYCSEYFMCDQIEFSKYGWYNNFLIFEPVTLSNQDNYKLTVITDDDARQLYKTIFKNGPFCESFSDNVVKISLKHQYFPENYNQYSKFAIFGCAKAGNIAYDLLSSVEKNIIAFIDDYYQHKTLNGIPVYTQEEFMEIVTEKTLIVKGPFQNGDTSAIESKYDIMDIDPEDYFSIMLEK